VLVSIADLKNYMDISFSLRQEDAAEMVLGGLQSELEAYLNRPIEVGTFTEEYKLPANHVGVPMSSFFYNTSLDTTMNPITYAQPPATIYLRNSPVVSVSQVRLKPRFQEWETLTEDRDFVVRRYGMDLFRGWADDIVEVTYDAGLAGNDIKMFKLMILRAATREMQNMHDDVVGVKDLEPRNVAPMETGFLEKELMAVKRYRRVQVS